MRQRNAPVDFQLKVGKRLRLRFVDESGKPIPEVFVSISSSRGGKSLYNIKHPIVLDTKIPEQATRMASTSGPGADRDKVDYSYGKPGYREASKVIAADGMELVIPLSKAGPGANDGG